MAKLLSLATYARRAYQNRYSYDSVTVSKAGAISGNWHAKNSLIGQGLAVPLGLLADCRTVQTDTGVRFYNRDFLVYTFALPGARP